MHGEFEEAVGCSNVGRSAPIYCHVWLAYAIRDEALRQKASKIDNLEVLLSALRGKACSGKIGKKALQY